MAARRRRLSSIDLLPAEAEEDVAWAVSEIKSRNRLQEDIRDELNLRLLAKGISPISRSAFNRYSLWIAQYSERLTQAREIAAIVAEKISDVPEGDVGLLLNETIKTLVLDVVQESMLSGESPSIKQLYAAAAALEKLERARKSNTDTAVKRAREFVEEAAETAVSVAKEQGLSGAAVDQIRREVLGVRVKPS